MVDAAEVAPPGDDEPPKKSKKGLLLGLVGAVLLGGGGFYAVYSGLLDSLISPDPKVEIKVDGEADIAFVAMDPIMVSLPPGSSAKHLRFIGQLEVEPQKMKNVASLMPRILDTMNTYLRAVDVQDLEQPSSVPKLRAQMLRRIQVVAGEGQVRDLLITEFVLN